MFGASPGIGSTVGCCAWIEGRSMRAPTTIGGWIVIKNSHKKTIQVELGRFFSFFTRLTIA
jgi:hypothetical protein